MPHPIAFQVSVPHTERLDRFLADQLAFSRTQAGRLVAEGHVTVNGDIGRAGRGLVRGDLLEVTVPERAAARFLKPHHVDLPVVFEDDWLLIVDKPAGLVVHPAPGHWDDTLVNALVARGTTLSATADQRPGIVHRLDRDTSGLMVIAKTDLAHRRLGKALQQRTIERTYAALAWGHLDEPALIDAPVARHPRDRKRMTVLATGRSARTQANQVVRFETCDLLRLRLETGRTHQIRVHLTHIGHPVVGDPVYTSGGARRVSPLYRRDAEAIERAASRQALHAARLRFRHPDTGHLLDFRAGWPADLEECLTLAMAGVDLVAPSEALEYLGFFQ